MIFLMHFLCTDFYYLFLFVSNDLQYLSVLNVVIYEKKKKSIRKKRISSLCLYLRYIHVQKLILEYWHLIIEETSPTKDLFLLFVIMNQTPFLTFSAGSVLSAVSAINAKLQLPPLAGPLWQHRLQNQQRPQSRPTTQRPSAQTRPCDPQGEGNAVKEQRRRLQQRRGKI